MSEKKSWRHRARAHLAGMRFDLGEAGGALGDLGTFVPIVVTLVALCDLDLGAVLFFAGGANIASGLLFNQPIPVQPMKAIAAVAISQALSPGAIAAAGLGAGAVILLLALTGLVELIERHVPRAVVRGIQLGVGLKLLLKGIELIGGTPVWALDGQLVAAAAAVAVLVLSRTRRLPTALLVFGAGLAIMAVKHPELLGRLSLGWRGPTPLLPDAEQWRTGLLMGTLPQLPLTLLNSVIAVCALSADLYPGRGIATRPMALSVASMNLVGCWFGAMPMCHGAGGLAGQHRFGGRTGGSVVMLGGVKVALALLFGSTAAVLLGAYPLGILGVLLCFSGAELALPARDARDRDAFFIVVLTAGGTMAIHTLAGVLMGLAAALLCSRGRTTEGDRERREKSDP